MVAGSIIVVALQSDPVVVPTDPVGEDPLGSRLLAAATAEFAARGYAGARVAEIARRAGVTTGAIYSRYRGKAELLAEAIDHATSGEFDRLFSDHRFEGRMQDILRIAGSHLVDRQARADHEPSPESGLLLESFTAARHEADVATLLRARMGDRHQRLAQVIDAAKTSGGIDAALDTTALVTLCHALGLGFLLLDVAELPLPDQAAWSELIERLLAATAATAATVPVPTGDVGAEGASDRTR
jgi:AcrR family transcriptional regulator